MRFLFKAALLLTALMAPTTAVQAQSLYTSSNGHLWLRGALGPSSGNDWSDAGPLPGVVDAMTWHVNGLYAVSGGNLWKRSLNNQTWTNLGDITAGPVGSTVTAITSHFRNNEQQLVISVGDHIYALQGGAWTDIGLALGITGLVSSSASVTPGLLNDTLYVTTGLNQICQRFGTGLGNTWDCYENSAYGIKGATILNGELLVAGSDSLLWKRGTAGVGPNTGNTWTQDGQIYGATSLAASTSFLGWSLVTSSNGRLWVRGALGPSSGNDWSDAGALPGVVNAMTWHVNGLYAVSGRNLWKRIISSPVWTNIGSITAGPVGSDITAMTSHFRNNEQQLVIAVGDHIYALEGGAWVDIGLALGITGLVSSSAPVTPGILPDTLYVTTGLNQICQRFGTGLGNTWDCYEGEAYGVKGATIFNGELIVAGSDSLLWKRTVGVGPNIGNTWTQEGQIFESTALAVLPTGYPY